MMKMLKCECAKCWTDAAPLVLRVGAGIIFILHGWMKFGGIDGVTGMLSSMGVPGAMTFAWIITLLEFVGGIALILGAMTHWVSKLLALEMLIAVILVWCNKGVFDQPALLLFAMTFSLMVTGAGKWSLDEWMMESCCGKCVNGVCPEHGAHQEVVK